MKRYRVIVTPDAEADFKVYLSYLRNVKKNPQAVKNVLEDFLLYYIDPMDTVYVTAVFHGLENFEDKLR